MKTKEPAIDPLQHYQFWVGKVNASYKAFMRARVLGDESKMLKARRQNAVAARRWELARRELVAFWEAAEKQAAASKPLIGSWHWRTFTGHSFKSGAAFGLFIFNFLTAIRTGKPIDFLLPALCLATAIYYQIESRKS